MVDLPSQPLFSRSMKVPALKSSGYSLILASRHESSQIFTKQLNAIFPSKKKQRGDRWHVAFTEYGMLCDSAS
jgi:hypothetical protein